MMINLSRNFNAVLLLLLVSVFVSCNNEQINTPKPKGYFRIDLPPVSYKSFEPTGCPYSFEIPSYAYPLIDSNRFAENCWYYLIFPKFNGQLYLTYKPITNNLQELSEYSRMMVYKHSSRASSINEKVLRFDSISSGIFYDIGGDAASPIQFYITDSKKHFIRGSLYFNTSPNADSIAPVVAYIKNDLLHLLSTTKWK